MVEDLQEFHTNQTEKMEQTLEKSSLIGILRRNSKILLVGLAIIIVLESIWAISYIKSSQTIKLPIVTKLSQKPKEKIASLTLKPQTVQTSIGQSFEISIVADMSNRTVNGIDAVIKYDGQMLELTDNSDELPGIQAVTGDLFQTLLVNSADPVEGKITLTGSRISTTQEPIKGTGTFARITFSPKQAGNTVVEILFDPDKTNLSNITEAKTSKNILTHTSNAQITIAQ